MPTVIDVQGEVLPPRISSSRALAGPDENLNLVATLLDDMFCIPGTKIRFGLDALIGWVPVLGDLMTGVASMLIIVSAWKRGAARITLARMLGNVAIETLVGSIPLVGDAAHVAWKANRRNYNLLVRDQQSRRGNTWKDWLFVVGLALAIIALFALPVFLLISLMRSHGFLHAG
ncbi:MAG: DUF4112 domain-containing protein [Acidobacteriales bacterium]|nr:DUF4112 domain-containing protein [Terriglobales bacterium]